MTGARALTPTLRRVVAQDASAVLELFASPGMDRQAKVQSMEQAQELTERLATPTATQEIFAVALADRLIGVIGISGIETTNYTGWCWYWMHLEHLEHRGQGLTSRATATVAAWALGERGLHRLELGHRVDLPRRAGASQDEDVLRGGSAHGGQRQGAIEGDQSAPVGHG